MTERESLVRLEQRVAELERANEELQRSEAHYRGLFDRIPTGFYRATPEGRILDANLALIEILGYPDRESLLAVNVMDIYTQAGDRQRWQTLLENAESVSDFEAPMYRHDGTIAVVRSSVRAVRDDAGQVAYYEGSVEDISARKEPETEHEWLLQTLSHQGTLLRAAADVSKAISTILNPEELMDRTVNLIQARFNFYYVGLFLVDEADGYAVLHAGTGKAGQQMLAAGHKLEVGGSSMIGWCTARGKARIALDVGEEAIRFDNPALPLTRSEMALPLLSRGRFCIGALTVQSSEAAAFRSDDIAILQTMADQLAIAIENARLYRRVENYAAELEDRVAQRTAELEAANRELEAFSYSVSHDLRAPLRAMDGFSRILIKKHQDQLSPEAARYLQMIQENAQQMGQLIDDLLSFSRLSRQVLKTQPVALADLARQVLRELDYEREGRAVEVTVGDLPPCEADPALLKHVLVNLLTNAFKFTRQREVARIEVGHRQVDGWTAYFVRDNGVGFDMQYANKLFGVFQRLHRAEEYEGTGVGLAIVQRIIHRHGGRVWAEAQVEEGASFYFTLGGGGCNDERSG
ncbi:MAG: PAS domain S-box protein [Anaerolineae bacterium]|nr:PAS domain S-box protein [Anaerolineae bacterium]